MTGVLIYGYLGGWIIASIGVALAAWRLQDKRQPATHPLRLSVLAGAMWPLLIVALVEAGVVALTQEVMHEDEEPLLSVVA